MKNRFLLCAVVTVCLALTTPAQDLLIEGPGNIFLQGQKMEPFMVTMAPSFAVNATLGSFIFGQEIPAGKMFVCTHISSAVYRASHQNFDVARAYRVVFEQHTGTKVIQHGFFSFSPETDPVVGEAICGNRTAQMFFKSGASYEVIINKDPSAASHCYVHLTLTGYLIDLP